MCIFSTSFFQIYVHICIHMYKYRDTHTPAHTHAHTHTHTHTPRGRKRRNAPEQCWEALPRKAADALGSEAAAPKAGKGKAKAPQPAKNLGALTFRAQALELGELRLGE